MASNEQYEDVDSKGLGKLKITSHKNESNVDPRDIRLHGSELQFESREVRPVAYRDVSKESTEYNMDHKRRGACLIISYSQYDKDLRNLSPRKCAEHDKNCTKSAFEGLGFDVKILENLKLSRLKEVLIDESKAKHDDDDCIVVVFMSHGYYDVDKSRQFLWAFDKKFKPNLLWKYFVPPRCISLAGKPKLFFIQACRGEKTDKGIQLRGLRSFTDEPQAESEESDIERDYSVSSYADFLKMWASYPGHFAFKSNNNGLKGSVFIHYLTKILEEDGQNENLESLLLKVKRKVTVEYESSMRCEDLNHNKQIPCVQSTLIRHVYFRNKAERECL